MHIILMIRSDTTDHVSCKTNTGRENSPQEQTWTNTPNGTVHFDRLDLTREGPLDGRTRGDP